MEFRIKSFFVAMAGIFLTCTVYAQCCDCEEYDGCNLGEENHGSLASPDCYSCGSAIYGPDCSFCNWCADFIDCPDGAPAGRKCKQVQNNCGGITNCTKYELCDPNNGQSGDFFVPSDVCHLESGACYSNARDCRDFASSIDYFNSSISLTGLVSGQASWDDDNKWNVSSCDYDVSGADVHDIFNCEQFSLHADASGYVASVSDSITYTVNKMYCSKCRPGYVPNIVTSPYSNGNINIVANPTGGDYGVVQCGSVTGQNYAPGCTIPYPLNSAEMPTECREQCPDGLMIYEDGATSINDCLPTNATYSDLTGSFRLGSNSSLCTP